MTTKFNPLYPEPKKTERILRRGACDSCDITIVVIRDPDQMLLTSRELKTDDIKLMPMHIGQRVDFVEVPLTNAEFEYHRAKISSRCDGPALQP